MKSGQTKNIAAFGGFQMPKLVLLARYGFFCSPVVAAEIIKTEPL
jgi:hypothetical protein